MENELESMSKQELIRQLLMLSSSIQKLESSIQKLESSNQKLESSNQKKDESIGRMEITIAHLQRMLFGTKKERFIFVNPAQLQFEFEEYASKEDLEDVAPVKEKITYERTKPAAHAGRNKLPENLPVVEEVIEPIDLVDSMVKMGEEITDILEYTPAVFFIRRIVRPKYINKSNDKISIAELPSRPIPKCIAGNSVLTQILVSKYVDHLPLYRQQQIFKRADIDIAPSTIDFWVARIGFILEVLYDKLVERLIKQGYIQADETTIKVLDSDKKGKTHLGYFWVYHAPVSKICIFDYQKGRGADAARQILDGFEGTLQTDGYKVYQQFCLDQKVTHIACWAHARRYFEKALEQDKERASHVLIEIQKLYAIERKTAEMTPEERHEARLNEALPIINNLGKWLHQQRQQVLPKSLIGKAIEYTTNLWGSLMNYLEHGEYHLDNNAIENKIRPVAIGRKNYLFAGSHEGAKRAAIFYTFFATCKLNNVNPEKWLQKVLDVIAEYPVNRLHELFPGTLEV